MYTLNPTQVEAEPEIKRSKEFSFDLETTGVDFITHKIVMLIIATPRKNYVWDVRKQWPAWVDKYFEDLDYTKYVHNGLFDCTFLQWHKLIRVMNVKDVMLQEQIANGVHLERKVKEGAVKDKYSTALGYTLKRYGLSGKKEELIPVPIRVGLFEEIKLTPPALSFAVWPDHLPLHKLQCEYGVADVAELMNLDKLQRTRLRENNLLRVTRLENEVLESFVQMRVNGINFNKFTWLEIAQKFKVAANAERKKLNRIATINWNSPDQIKKYFAAHEGIIIPTFKRLDKKFKGRCEDLDTFIYYRTYLHACANTFGEKWLRYNDKKKRLPVIRPDGRIHPDFIQIVSTGRGSCSDPNLQNLPNTKAKKTGIDQHLRAFIASIGCKLVVADYSGQEFALMMYLAGEKFWLDKIRKRRDVHSIMSKEANTERWLDAGLKDCIFEASYKKCKCPGHLIIRDETKKTTFGIAYGKGADETALDIDKSPREARLLIKAIFREAPILKHYLVQCGRDGLMYRESFTPPPFNRYRKLIGNVGWHIKNQAINSPIQGAGGDMIKQAMVYIQRKIDGGWYKHDARLLLWIHDAVATEVKKEYADEWAEVVSECMEKAGAVITDGEKLIGAEVNILNSLMK